MFLSKHRSSLLPSLGIQQGGTEDGKGYDEEFSEFKSDSSSHFSDLLFIFVFMSVVVFRAVYFLLFGFAVGDRLSENADDHGQKT